jgi:hypothetical protein
MAVVVKATGVGDLAERLICGQQCSAIQQARGVIQTKRIDVFTAGRAALSKEFLEVTQRNPRFGCHFSGAKIRICKAISDDVADAGEQLVCMARDGPRVAL